MTWYITTPRAGITDIESIWSTNDPLLAVPQPQVPVGTVVRAQHPTYGEAEFIYLPGVANNVVGALVNYEFTRTGSGTVASPYVFGSVALVDSDTAATMRGPVAVSMSANTGTGNYSWYQISGLAIVKAATVADNALVYASSTGGTVDDAAGGGGLKVDGALFKSADGTPSAGFALVQIDRPTMNGNG